MSLYYRQVEVARAAEQTTGTAGRVVMVHDQPDVPAEWPPHSADRTATPLVFIEILGQPNGEAMPSGTLLGYESFAVCCIANPISREIPFAVAPAMGLLLLCTPRRVTMVGIPTRPALA